MSIRMLSSREIKLLKVVQLQKELLKFQHEQLSILRGKLKLIDSYLEGVASFQAAAQNISKETLHESKPG